MDIHIHIGKKHFIFLVTILLLITMIMLSTSLPEVDTSKAYHYMQQIAIGPNNGNANENVSIDSDGDGVIDNADTIDGYDSIVLLNEWSPSAPATGIFYDGGNVGIGTNDPQRSLDVVGYMQAYTYYDGNDNTFYVNPNSVSKMLTVDANNFRDRDDTSFYLNPAGTSNLNYLQLNSGTKVNAIQTTLSGGSNNELLTEGAIKTYIDNQVGSGGDQYDWIDGGNLPCTSACQAADMTCVDAVRSTGVHESCNLDVYLCKCRVD